jgi:hypothetical protein
MSSSSTTTQKQQQDQRRRMNHNSQQSRNTNAYFGRDEYHRRSLINNNHYWSSDDFYTDNYYQHQNSYPSSSQRIRKKQPQNNNERDDQRYNSKSNYSYYDNIPPRHRLQQQTDKREHPSRLQEPKTINKPVNSSPIITNNEQQPQPLHSVSSSSTNSDLSTNRKDLHSKNLAAAAIAARQQNPQAQTNIGVVQALMNSLILQQQQPTQSQSTVQLQYQLTNALLATSIFEIDIKTICLFFFNLVIQQRLKETALQAQAQQIQAALPTLLAAQALVYQQQHQQGQSILSPNVAHPGTKFNNRPLVKFPVTRPTISPNIRSSTTTNSSRHRLGINTQQAYSATTLPTYQQVQEIERGISLDEAIHSKGAIDIADRNGAKTETIPMNEKDY